MNTKNTKDHLGRLNAAADAARTELESQPVERWEFFAKASFTRESEVTPGKQLRAINVEETGVAVRSTRNGRAGFAAASGLEGDAPRRAVEGALETETPAAFDPLPPQRLLGTSPVPSPRQLPPTGWAGHVGEEGGQRVEELVGDQDRLDDHFQLFCIH